MCKFCIKKSDPVAFESLRRGLNHRFIKVYGFSALSTN